MTLAIMVESSVLSKIYQSVTKHGKSRHLANIMVFTAVAENHGLRDFCNFVIFCCP